MPSSTFIKLFSPSTLLLVAGLATVGCNTTVTNGNGCPIGDASCEDDDIGEDDEDDTIGNDGDEDEVVDPNPGSTAIAFPYAQLGGDVVPAPEGTILIAFGSEPRSCGNVDPDLPHCQVALTWAAEIPLPVELQVAGAVVDLESLIDVGYGPFFTESVGEGEGECSGGGGTLSGTLEVLDINDDTITIRITDALVFDADANGERTIPRCP